MTTIRTNELKKALKDLDRKELIGLIEEMHDLNDDTRQFLANKFIGEDAIEAAYLKAKKQINDEFFPEEGITRLRLNVAKKAITDFKKVSGDDCRMVELMLFYVENGTEFSRRHGDMNDNFYASMISMYERALKIYQNNTDICDDFKDRFYNVVVKSKGTIWGYYEALAEMYQSAFEKKRKK
ncbi:DUF6155 family protein [Salisediminibacterium halotolerans]|uniref:Uncharacterized protein n=1 Tax=Salisediminibacterium halotolerans TaxID=517425 RepID=A0A1H9TNS8_9BACI|nr:DUF6155 family protein [Salisediminibacterium haloalkalitolerans]SER98579.1 hypothetical protein SAMN05444126_11094 [Salisediminibacterium haloalkalitolerans]